MVADVLKTKSAAKLPFAMILMGFLVTSSWLAYGLMLANNFIITPNVIGVAINAAQLLLFAMYSSSSSKSKGSKSTKAKHARKKKDN